MIPMPAHDRVEKMAPLLRRLAKRLGRLSVDKPVDPLGLTEQQRSDSALNEMIETLPSPFKSMSGMYNGMTVRPAAQPVDNPVDNR